MNCAVCGKECDGSYCDDCRQLMVRLKDCYTLKQLSTIFVYVLGAKAVEDLTEGMAAKLTEDYAQRYLKEEVFSANVQ